MFTLEMENTILLKNGFGPRVLLMLKCDKAAVTAGSLRSPCLGGTAAVGLLGAGLGGLRLPSSATGSVYSLKKNELYICNVRGDRTAASLMGVSQLDCLCAMEEYLLTADQLATVMAS